MSKAVVTHVGTEIEAFRPSVKMIEYLNSAVELLTDSPSKVEQNCNVARKSWYRWQEVEGFVDWFYSEYAKRRRKVIPKLDKIGMQHAKRGDFDFWKAMNQKVGELAEDTQAPVNVQVNNLIAGQSSKYKLED